MIALLLVPHTLDPKRRAEIDRGRRPKPDYDALADRVRQSPHGRADILDRGAVDRSKNPLIRLVRRLFGYNWALALMGFLCCAEYDVVFSHAENVGKPFALLLMTRLRPPRHVMQAYYVTGRRNVLWYRLLRIASRIDVLFLLSKMQREAALGRLAIPGRKVVLVEAFGFLDIDFFRSYAGGPPRPGQVCAVGREFRDYGTLFRAVDGLPCITLKVDANSPWSTHEDGVKALAIPGNVELCDCELGAVRELYGLSEIVAIPLLPNEIGAGLTSLLEAMAMGKPVVLTCSADGTYAGRETIVDGKNVLMVGPGDIEGWRTALARLAADPELRRRLGEHGRQWVEQNVSRQRWLAMMMDALSPDRTWTGAALASRS